MKLTNEEIEAVNGRLMRCIRRWVPPDTAAAALFDINALCTAAREPESLVGRRVRLKNGLVLKIETVEPQRYVIPYRLGGYSLKLTRNDFELLEDCKK